MMRIRLVNDAVAGKRLNSIQVKAAPRPAAKHSRLGLYIEETAVGAYQQSGLTQGCTSGPSETVR